MILATVCAGSGQQANGETVPTFRWTDKIVWPNMMSGYGLAVDQEGNTFFTGHMYQSFVFGNLAFSDSGLVLAKCDQAGNPLWAVREGGLMTVGVGLGLDRNQNVFVLCEAHSASPILLAGTSVTALVALAKYDKSGQGVWAKPVVNGATSLLSTIVCAPSVDSMGNSYWGFFLNGTVSFGKTNVTVPGISGALVKCDPEGEVVWVRVAGATSESDFVAMGTPGVDSNGNVYLCGRFAQSASFGDTTLTTSAAASVFLAKYSGEGDLLWLRQSGPGGSTSSERLAVDGLGNCFIQVRYTETATFGDIILSNSVPSTNFGVVKYDSSGNVRWAKQVCDGWTRASVAADPTGNCYYAAECTDGSVLYVKYDPEGNIAWSKSGLGLEVAGLRVDALGQCYSMGRLTASNTSFDSIDIVGADPTSDCYLAKLNTTTVPRLNVGASNGVAIVSWPLLAEGFYLESSDDLGSSAWTSNSALPEVTGSLKQVTLQTDGTRFFRLKRD